jgi:hypothetical protein
MVFPFDRQANAARQKPHPFKTGPYLYFQFN